MKESAKKTPKFIGLNELTVALDNVVSPEEQKELQEEGIELTTIPWIEDKEN